MNVYCPRCDARVRHGDDTSNGLPRYECPRCGTKFATDRDADGDRVTPPHDRTARPTADKRTALAAV